MVSRPINRPMVSTQANRTGEYQAAVTTIIQIEQVYKRDAEKLMEKR
jgi:hypothetical protein